MTRDVSWMASVSFLEDAIVSDSSARTRSDAAATRLWVERLERFAAGNHTVVAFCAAEGVSESNFYLWKRQLAQHVPSATSHAPTVVPRANASKLP